MKLRTMLGLILCITWGQHISAAELVGDESKHLANLKQVTNQFSRAGEGYFSPDGTEIVYQAYPIGYPFYQIYLQNLESGDIRRMSPGRGRTTCSYFSPDGSQILFASAHTDPQAEVTEKKAWDLSRAGGKRRYQWDFDPHMDIYVSNHDGTNLTQLTNTPGYDAEGSYSSDGKQIVFTSSRDGDPEIFLMNSDGSNVRQITSHDGYDGGPFFSPDNRWIIFRSDREKEHMLQLYAISVEGKHEVQLTKNLGEVNWCPYFHPSGKYLVWSSADYTKGHRGAAFNLFTMEIEMTESAFKGGEIEQITFSNKADVLPVFSPDGTKLMWTSTRTKNGTSQLWMADWIRGKMTDTK